MVEVPNKAPQADQGVAERLRVARVLLAKPSRPERVWPAMAAATALAVSALAFAAVVILAPVPLALISARP